MPTYDYKCSHCGYLFEETQSMKDAMLTKCPECGNETLVRLIGSGGGMIFKGSGFYQTDYKNAGSSKKDSSSEKKTETKTTDSSSTEKKNESKPAESSTKPSSETKQDK